MRGELKDVLIDFGLPFLIITLCASLLLAGKDGEYKSILTLSAGWVFKSGFTRKVNRGDK